MSDAPIIEKMARAIADVDGATCFERERPDSDALVDLLRGSICATYRKQARAALEAIREPSEAMVEAGRFPAEDDGPVACWTAMIDAALLEGR